MTTFAFNVSDGEEQNPALGLVALLVVTASHHFKVRKTERNKQSKAEVRCNNSKVDVG